MKSVVVTLTLAVLVLAAVACVPIISTPADRLLFRVDIFDEPTGEFVISPKVENVGMTRSAPRPNANAVMELRDAHNILRARMEIVSLIAIEPGTILDPAVWRGRLDPGAYRVFWGAPGLGHTEAGLFIVEQDGRLQLGDLLIAFHLDRDMPALPVYGDAQPLVDLAVAQLAEQLDVQADLIRATRVEPRDFPDAGLDAPQPGEMYAQVVTPGYVIELSCQGLPYLFHGGGERVVPAPGPAAGNAAPGLVVGDWMTVEVDEAAISFQAPAGWQGPTAWVWAAPGDPGQLLGFQLAQISPPNLPEALFLPSNARNLASEAVDLDWAAGRWHEVEVYRPAEQGQTGGQVEFYERHVILLFERAGQRIGLDFYARAQTQVGLAGLRPLLDRMVASAAMMN